MLSSSARVLALNKATLTKHAVHTRLISSVPSSMTTDEKKQKRREIHQSARREADATAEAPVTTVTAGKNSLMRRFTITAEVTVSKVRWQ
jgi:hypothetical protein